MFCDLTCVPCRGGIPPLSAEEAGKLQVQTPDWGLMENSTRLERTFKFENFRAALAFTNQIGELAEEQGHHPDMTVGWGYCKIVLYTHKINGLHQNDFIMAAKADSIFLATEKN